jgi:SpoIID/LytB domain protein
MTLPFSGLEAVPKLLGQRREVSGLPLLRPTFKRHIALLAVVVGFGVLSAGLPALALDNEVTVNGGGWGHGIGMSQHGAQALANDGFGVDQILQHFYTGATIGTVGQVGLVGHAEPLRIGVGQKMTRFDFMPVNGAITLTGGLTALPNQEWSLRVHPDGSCQFYFGEGAQGAPMQPCSGELTWADQPSTRVQVSTLNRTYARGKIVFVPVLNTPGTFHLLVEVPLEQYLYGLAEMPSSWHMEALKAQAVAGRTYALYKAYQYRNLAGNTARMNACGCHLYTSTLDQAYNGWTKESEVGTQNWGARWVAAVNATAGKALVHTYTGGLALEAYYSSSSGGATENNEDQWGGSPRPYLRTVPDPGATAWSAVFSQSQFSSNLGFDNVFSAVVGDRFASGSPKTIVVQGYAGGSPLTKSFTGNQFRQALGLRSHYVFDVTGIVPFLPGADRTTLHDPSTGKWRSHTPAGTITEIYFGNPGDFGFMGDWDCDGIDTPGLYRRTDGYVYLRNSNTQGIADASFFFGNPGDLPMAGDFNGDGCDTVSIYRPSEGQFYIINALGSADAGLGAAEYSYYYGNPGDQPFMGDFNGDGIDTPGLRRDSTGFVYLRFSNTQGVADVDYFYGNSGDVVFTGDWDNNGIDTLGLYRPSNGSVYLRNSNDTGIAHIAYEMGTSSHRPVAGTQ